MSGELIDPLERLARIGVMISSELESGIVGVSFDYQRRLKDALIFPADLNDRFGYVFVDQNFNMFLKSFREGYTEIVVPGRSGCNEDCTLRLYSKLEDHNDPLRLLSNAASKVAISDYESRFRQFR